MKTYILSSPRVCVFMINWNGQEHLKYSIPPLLAQDYKNFDIVVIDNASTDNSIMFLNQDFPQVKVIKNRKNLGFTGAANLGINYAADEEYDLYLLLSNDIVLDSRCISIAVDTYIHKEKVGMVGFNMIGALSYAPYEIFILEQKKWTAPKCEESNYIEGAAYLSDPHLIKRIGGYDEMLFMYGDENDLEIRLQRIGYNLIKTNALAWHNCGRNIMGSKRCKSAFYVMRNTLIISTKYFSIHKFMNSLLSVLYIALSPKFIDSQEEEVAGLRGRPSKNIFINLVIFIIAFSCYLSLFIPVLVSRLKVNKMITLEKGGIS